MNELKTPTTPITTNIVSTDNLKSEPEVDLKSEMLSIARKLEQDEIAIENKLKSADELSDMLTLAIKKKLGDSLDKENDSIKANIIFVDQFPDIIQAQARLLSLSVDGKAKVSAIRKVRYSILKTENDSKDSDDLNIGSFL